MSVLDNKDSQDKLCRFLRGLCLYSTFVVVTFLIFAIWNEHMNSKFVGKITLTYLLILGGSWVVHRIFVKSDHS